MCADVTCGQGWGDGEEGLAPVSYQSLRITPVDGSCSGWVRGERYLARSRELVRITARALAFFSLKCPHHDPLQPEGFS